MWMLHFQLILLHILYCQILQIKQDCLHNLLMLEIILYILDFQIFLKDLLFHEYYVR